MLVTHLRLSRTSFSVIGSIRKTVSYRRAYRLAFHSSSALRALPPILHTMNGETDAKAVAGPQGTKRLILCFDGTGNRYVSYLPSE